ncbi:MAG: hypothetical protein JXA50_06175 [Deltaproteobacteria bacterium]|nr:hypothetical protein [Deltaproteobacteria bacterium]
MRKLFIILLFTLLLGCNVDLSTDYKVSDNYYVSIIDIPEDRSLYYDLGDGSGIGRVNGGVIAVGWDNDHIIVEQYKDNKNLFYILEINKDSKYAVPSESVSGPFNETEFNEIRTKLNVDAKLGFSKRFSS